MTTRATTRQLANICRIPESCDNVIEYPLYVAQRYAKIQMLRNARSVTYGDRNHATTFQTGGLDTTSAQATQQGTCLRLCSSQSGEKTKAYLHCAIGESGANDRRRTLGFAQESQLTDVSIAAEQTTRSFSGHRLSVPVFCHLVVHYSALLNAKQHRATSSNNGQGVAGREYLYG